MADPSRSHYRPAPQGVGLEGGAPWAQPHSRDAAANWPGKQLRRPRVTSPAREHYDTLKAADVLASVEAAVYTPEVALAFEQERDKPRKTVVEALEPQDDGTGEDASDDEA